MRVLTDVDLPQVRMLLAARPVVDVFVASRVAVAGLSEWRLGAQMWGFERAGVIESLCYAGANVWPVSAGPEAIAAFALQAKRHHRRCASIVGLASEVLPLWELLRPVWGPAPRAA